MPHARAAHAVRWPRIRIGTGPLRRGLWPAGPACPAISASGWPGSAVKLPVICRFCCLAASVSLIHSGDEGRGHWAIAKKKGCRPCKRPWRVPAPHPSRRLRCQDCSISRGSVIALDQLCMGPPAIGYASPLSQAARRQHRSSRNCRLQPGSRQRIPGRHRAGAARTERKLP